MRETKQKLIEGKHFYWENGKFIFTELYHRQRGYCCGQGCLNCAYDPKHIKGNVKHKNNKNTE